MHGHGQCSWQGLLGLLCCVGLWKLPPSTLHAIGHAECMLHAAHLLAWIGRTSFSLPQRLQVQPYELKEQKHLMYLHVGKYK